jgi:hypothetical protein
MAFFGEKPHQERRVEGYLCVHGEKPLALKRHFISKVCTESPSQAQMAKAQK